MDFKLKKILRNAVYAALYVALCYVFQPISFAAIQIRIAESLCILPLFDDMAILSISIGCFLANLIFSGIVDAVFGTLATFIGLLCIKLIKIDNFFIKMLPTILSNAFIIPFVLRVAFGETMPLWLLSLTIAAGEIVAVYILGFVLYKVLSKNYKSLFK